MHQYEIEAAINNAVNGFVVNLGAGGMPWHINQILPDGESGLFDDEVIVKKVNVSIDHWSFDFLVVVRGQFDCYLYMDARTSLMVMEMKIRDLEGVFLSKMKDHLQTYPHNIGM